MHPNPIFRKTAEGHNFALAREVGFGSLAVSADPVPLLAHVPFTVSQDEGHLDLHLVRSNPIARAFEGETPARLSVMGPHGYISPDWYGIEDQVPTWNYIAVQFTGRLEALDHSELPAILDDLSDTFEARLAPKPSWEREKMSSEAWDKMIRQILPFRFWIEDVQSTWKLGQNKDDAARLGAANSLETSGIGSNLTELAASMKTPPNTENQ